ncbi:ribosome recycling factor [Thermodesulfatator indicus DSM 15286]|uniref:Ribosome-recycling factor n=1 Tax=Thermodesulfatator indicus (strain DSM 15286 / JCM 11887 / CIR29812) TaxID=667014 RepID=F8ADC5_THEID|nr:ribosome recycling factor [Thermodesulfatator indicus]AEH45940.1 ribosome recycling factor [Thermodesulfatator indicus DSM 15286]
MIKDLLEDAKRRMAKSVETFKNEIARIRTGRASVALLDGVKVDYYGTLMPLNQMATISVADAHLILVQPWDVSAIGAIEKAIQRAELGLNPVNDGKVIRIAVPPLTEERRKELVKMVRKIAEEARVAVRNIRRDVMDDLKELKKEGEISEDDFFRAQEQVQKITDEFIGKIEKLLEQKEKDIMTI